MLKLYPETVLRQSRWVRDAEARAKRIAETLRISEHVDTLLSLLERYGARLLPNEVAELNARSFDQLPSVESTLDTKTREQFLKLAGLSRNPAGRRDLYPIEPEELATYESFLEKFYPEAVLRRTRWVREAEARAKAMAKARRVSERVDTLVTLLRRRNTELHPDEVAQLNARSFDQLPSVESTLDVKTREEFLELAGLSGHTHPVNSGTDSAE